MINDKFINEQELKSELKNMLEMAEQLNLKLLSLSHQLAYIFSQIKICTTLQNANDYFELLDKIQADLSCLLYKHNICLTDRLLRFVQDFDNLEPIYREYYYQKIISGEYSF